MFVVLCRMEECQFSRVNTALLQSGVECGLSGLEEYTSTAVQYTTACQDYAKQFGANILGKFMLTEPLPLLLCCLAAQMGSSSIS